MLLVGFYFGDMGMKFIEIMNKVREELGFDKTPITQEHQVYAIAARVKEIQQCLDDESNKAEREAQQHWYDYKNQKALRLPPVGEVVEVFTDGNFKEAKVLEQTSNGLDDVIVCRVFDRPINSLGTLKYFSTARPLDWNKHRAAAVNELTDLIKAEGVEGITAVSCADSILAAGYRKCDN